jgi:hypothetical protein
MALTPVQAIDAVLQFRRGDYSESVARRTA